jgi:hypothetical protein
MFNEAWVWTSRCPPRGRVVVRCVKVVGVLRKLGDDLYAWGDGGIPLVCRPVSPHPGLGVDRDGRARRQVSGVVRR